MNHSRAGMLEQQRLCICYAPVPGHQFADSESVRADGKNAGKGIAVNICSITEQTTGRPLGYAYQRSTLSCCMSWLFPPCLEVYEADDEPLLFTVRRSWLIISRWRVRDADGCLVGG